MFKKIVIILTAAIFTIMLVSEADARRGGFRSSGFKSRSYSKPKPVRTHRTSARSKKPTGRKQVSKRTYTKPKPKFGANVKTKQRVAKSRSAYKQQQSAFKAKPKPTTYRNNNGKTVTVPRKKYTTNSNPIINRTTTINRTTYINRRSSYYGNWSTPPYAYHGYSSYGMWDSLALWYMLSHINDHRYSRMYYHQQNTPGMAAWRLEAEKQAHTNAELRSQLAQLDSSVTNLKQQNVPVDPSYIPDGVDADILLSAEVLADTKPSIKVCTGPADKNYYHVAKLIGKHSDAFNIVPIVTAGSEENLVNIETGKCDAALVQRDAYWNHTDGNPTSTLDFERIMSPYAEVVHLVCNESSGVETLSDLSSDTTVLIGAPGSGSQVTWSNMVTENRAYASVKVANIGGALAKTRVSSGQADCLLTVSGLNTKFMREVNSLGGTKTLNLVEWNDSSIMSSVDPAGEPVYSTYTLSDDVYNNLQHDNWIGYFNVDNDAITVPADIIVNNSWIKANKTTFNSLVSATTQSLSDIQQYVGTK